MLRESVTCDVLDDVTSERKPNYDLTARKVTNSELDWWLKLYEGQPDNWKARIIDSNENMDEWEVCNLYAIKRGGKSVRCLVIRPADGSLILEKWKKLCARYDMKGVTSVDHGRGSEVQRKDHTSFAAWSKSVDQDQKVRAHSEPGPVDVGRPAADGS